MTGTVKNLTNYCAFVDLGGIDGMLHISEMSSEPGSQPQSGAEGRPADRGYG